MFEYGITIIIIIINRHACNIIYIYGREESCIIMVPWLRAPTTISLDGGWFSSVVLGRGCGQKWWACYTFRRVAVEDRHGVSCSGCWVVGVENISHLNRISRNALGSTLWTVYAGFQPGNETVAAERKVVVTVDRDRWTER